MIKKWIRDSIHGDIDISEKVIIDLINSREFQRLRRISQLGGAQFVFPTATHTRFSHCIGVYHIISKILERIPDFNKLSPLEKILVRIAGLLHDLGHGPFSHSFEKILGNWSHEQYTISIINDPNSEVHQILLKYNINVELIIKIINKTHPKKVLVQLVSSQIDCDRMDYLLRDSYYTGVKYGTFDLDWIIQHMRISNDEVVFHSKAIFAIENYLLSRYHMYWQIYGHNISFSFDVLLKKIFLRLKDLTATNFKFETDLKLITNLLRAKPLEVKEYYYLDDYTFVHLIKNLTNEKDKILSDLCLRLINRKFFKVVRDYSEEDIKKYKAELLKKGYDERYYFEENITSGPVLYQTNSKESIKIIDQNENIINLENKLALIASNKTENEKKLIFAK